MNGRYYVMANNLNQNVTQMWFLRSPWLFLEKAQLVRNLVHSVPGGAAPLGLRTYKKFRREGEEKKKLGYYLFKIHKHYSYKHWLEKTFPVKIFMFLHVFEKCQGGYSALITKNKEHKFSEGNPLKKFSTIY